MRAKHESGNEKLYHRTDIGKCLRNFFITGQLKINDEYWVGVICGLFLISGVIAYHIDTASSRDVQSARSYLPPNVHLHRESSSWSLHVLMSQSLPGSPDSNRIYVYPMRTYYTFCITCMYYLAFAHFGIQEALVYAFCIYGTSLFFPMAFSKLIHTAAIATTNNTPSPSHHGFDLFNDCRIFQSTFFAIRFGFISAVRGIPATLYATVVTYFTLVLLESILKSINSWNGIATNLMELLAMRQKDNQMTILSYLLLCVLFESCVSGVDPEIAGKYLLTDDGRMYLFKTILMIEFVNSMSLSLLKIASIFGERMVVNVLRSNGVGVSNDESEVQNKSNIDSNILSLIWYTEMFVLLFV